MQQTKSEADKLMESGTILYLREHEKEMKRLRYTIIAVAFVAVTFVFWVIYTNRVGYAVEVARQMVRSCKGI